MCIPGRGGDTFALPRASVGTRRRVRSHSPARLIIVIIDYRLTSEARLRPSLSRNDEVLSWREGVHSASGGRVRGAGKGGGTEGKGREGQEREEQAREREDDRERVKSGK